MAYNGSTKLVSGLRVQGSGTFPLVNAPDVYVDDNTRLDGKLSSLDNAIGAINDAKGSANGIATLDSNGKVPSTQLPGFVDEIVEYPSRGQFPATGSSGTIYVDISTSISYRWSGTQYSAISSDLALGETAQSAYRGDRGKVAYDHAQAKGSAFATGLWAFSTNSEGHVTSARAATKADIGLDKLEGVFYAVCSTGASTQRKDIQVTDITSLYAGLNVRVKFTDAQSYDGIPQLKINDLAAANIVRNDSESAGKGEWKAGEVLDFVYDGSSFIRSSEKIIEYSDATQSAEGLMSATDKTNLDALVSAMPNKKNTQTAVADPTASGTSLSFISGISQNAQGVISPSKKTVPTFTGCTSSANGSAGLVPAPEASSQARYLMADGSWGTVPTTNVIVFQLDNVVASTVGPYSHTTQIAAVNANMKPVQLEVSNAGMFNGSIIVETGNGGIALSCDSVTVGTSTVKVSCIYETPVAEITGSDFNTLAGRIGTLSNLTTTDKNNCVAAINEVNNYVSGQFMTVEYSYAYTITAGNTYHITATQFGLTTPAGYTPFAAGVMRSGNGSVCVSGFDIFAEGDEYVMDLKNTDFEESRTPTARITIIYIKLPV